MKSIVTTNILENCWAVAELLLRSFDFDDRLPPIIVLTTMLQKRLFDKSAR